jgi:acetyl esterase/lipase
VYPAYLIDDSIPSRLAPEVQPTRDTPPTFLIQTEDDPIGVGNSLRYYAALKEAGVPAELHVYPTGGHGYGLRSGVNEITAVWPALALRWLGTRP